MATAGGVLGVLVVIAVVSDMVMMGARFGEEPRRKQLHPRLAQRPGLTLTTSGHVGHTYSPLAATATSCVADLAAAGGLSRFVGRNSGAGRAKLTLAADDPRAWDRVSGEICGR